MPSFAADRVVQAPADLVWAVVADLAGYAQLAPGLSHVEILQGVQEGLRRRCYDHHGRGWNETCTLWEPGHRYQMRVDTASYPFPLRQLLRSFQGTWSVDPVPEGTRITVGFDAEPRLGPLGQLALRAMGRKADRDLTQLLDNYEHAIRARSSAGRRCFLSVSGVARQRNLVGSSLLAGRGGPSWGQGGAWWGDDLDAGEDAAG